MQKRLPDFLILGAMKSGTTTLHQHLSQNPYVFMSKPKETNFFSFDEVYQRGTDWYASQFANASSEQLCGEASPSYTRFPRFPETANRIAKLLPEAKLIYIMRHPVERFYSNYVYDRTYGYKDSIREIIRNRTYVLETSNYMLQIERYLEHFPRKQMLFLLLEDLQQDPQLVIKQLTSFLGLEVHQAKPLENLNSNPRGRNRLARQCNTTMQRLRNTPGVSAFKRIIPSSVRGQLRDVVTKKLPYSRLGGWIAKQHKVKTEALSLEIRQELLDRLAEPTSRLEKFLGRDLTAWQS